MYHDKENVAWMMLIFYAVKVVFINLNVTIPVKFS